jgi:hypothetical protein
VLFSESNFERQINHRTMRRVIGAIAILLAPVTYVFADVTYSITSISATYWTNSGDLFVGSLISVGFFLAAYNGTGGHPGTEFWLSKASAIFAIGIALFPTTGTLPEHVEPSWTISLTGIFSLEPMNFHFGSAVALFTCLIAMMWHFSTRAIDKGRPVRAMIYKIIAFSMGAGIITIGLLGKLLFDWENWVLIVEVWGLTLFGAGWLLAGFYNLADEAGSQKNTL